MFIQTKRSNDSPQAQRALGASLTPLTDGLEDEARRLRLNTLIRLRWLAVVGQAVAIGVAAGVFGFRFPVFSCLVLVAASAALNLVLRWRYPSGMRLSESGATLLLGYDILQLAALLFLTGGMANPFVILLLAPVTTAATSLPIGRALELFALTLAAATAVLAFSLPLPWFDGVDLALPPLYALTRWVALAVSAGFVALYAYRVAEEARQTSAALTATELALARVQHLSQLDGLAAAAAHELGTPLATISLVARELEADASNAGSAEDLKLIDEQVERCREILNKLSSARLAAEEPEISSPVELVEMAAAPHRLLGVTISVRGEGPSPPPRCPRNPGILFGLGNLIENAVGFAEGAVSIQANWTKTAVRIVITDDGAGFPAEVLARVGEPYLSRRAAAKRDEGGRGGRGLGLFIAQSLLERSRAILGFANAQLPASGAIVTIEWSRTAYEQGRPVDR